MTGMVARLPIDPATKRRPKLTYIARTNMGWIKAACALVEAGERRLAFDKGTLVRQPGRVGWPGSHRAWQLAG